MSDFLIRFGTSTPGAGLLGWLQDLFRPDRREGTTVTQPTSEAAVLRELIGKETNWVSHGSTLLAWIGDVPGGRQALATLAPLLDAGLPAGADALVRALARCGASQHFDGSGALIISTPQWTAVFTDPMAGVQVYLGTDSSGAPRALGSHPDLVAMCAGRSGDLDPVSLVEYLDAGTPCCPHTMYRGVTEVTPGTVLVVTEGQVATAPWWTPPAEEPRIDLRAAAEEFSRLWRRSVEKRCSGQRIGVQLSGGMDSRAVMSVIPADLECTGLTFGDEINREALISENVARCYRRGWKFLPRDAEYLAQTAPHATRFAGCEGEWHHAHAIGLLPAFREGGFSDVFTGLFMDNNFKGYYAEDVVPVRRGGGWLAPGYKRQPRDYVHETSRWVADIARPELLQGRLERRRRFVDGHFARGRQSEWEWLDGHPVSQASDNTGWFVERRLLPLRLPVYDRALVDLAFRLPALAKAGGEFFSRALVLFLGPGNWLPNANDGSKPGSSPAVQQIQRLARKGQRSVRAKLEKLGFRGQVPHSWHDYRHYWFTSPVVRGLLQDHSRTLAEHDRVLKNGSLTDYLQDRKLPWRQSYRLLQLSLWTDSLKSGTTRSLVSLPAMESGFTASSPTCRSTTPALGTSSREATA